MTSRASCPPPRMTNSFLGVIAAVFSGVSAVKVLRTFRLFTERICGWWVRWWCYCVIDRDRGMYLGCLVFGGSDEVGSVSRHFYVGDCEIWLVGLDVL